MTPPRRTLEGYAIVLGLALFVSVVLGACLGVVLRVARVVGGF